MIFVAKPVWDFLKTSGTVTVRLEQNRSQNNLLNYVITNCGTRTVKDVRVEFSRAPKDRGELWTVGKNVTKLTFGSLAPGQRHTSMFAPGTASVEPIGVKVSYLNGPFFTRFGRYLLPSVLCIRRATTATLDMSEYLNFRYNVGYEGKKRATRCSRCA